MTYLISGNAPALYPVETFFGILHCKDGKKLEIPYKYPLYGEWGAPVSNVIDDFENLTTPEKIDLIYLSIVEEKFYSLVSVIPEDAQEMIEHTLSHAEDAHLVVGFAPYGFVCIWISTSSKRHFLCSFEAEETDVPMKAFRSLTPDIKLHKICSNYLDFLTEANENLRKYGLPSCNLYPKLMHQFKYRYVVLFQNWNEDEQKWENYEEDDKVVAPELCYIEDSLSDGTFDKLHDEGLFKYHFGGKPQKMTLKWKIKKSEYSAHLWFEDERICYIFEKFYGVHRDTNTDFIIHIDVEKRKYELALYRYGLSEPVIIPEETYQMIVFKNKFEHYRSHNYSQRRGAWIW